MMNFFLWAFVFTLTSGIFNFTLKLSAAARTFEGLDVSLAQSSVVAIGVDENGNPYEPYFDGFLFEARARAYFQEGLDRFFQASEWSLIFRYDLYRVDTEEETCYPAKVEVDFSCAIAGLSDYRNYRSFTIVKGAAYGQ